MDGQTDGLTDGGDYNIPFAILKMGGYKKLVKWFRRR